MRAGSYQCVEELLRAEADLNDRDGCSGYTPLHHAVDCGMKAIAALLLMQVKRIKQLFTCSNVCTGILFSKLVERS